MITEFYGRPVEYWLELERLAKEDNSIDSVELAARQRVTIDVLEDKVDAYSRTILLLRDEIDRLRSSLASDLYRDLMGGCDE